LPLVSEVLSRIGLCKHIHAVKFWVASQTFLQEKPKPKIFSEDSIQCDKCGSIRVIKYGFSDGKQIYKCRDCKHKFRYSLIKKAKYSPDTVSVTLDLYFSGMSLRKIARVVQNQTNSKLSYLTVYRWMEEFIPKISEYVDPLAPRLSDVWHGDELFVKMRNGINIKGKGDSKYIIAFLWNAMDRETRFLLASKLSRFRDDNGAFQAFKEARKNAHGQW
jgi:putative transposase